jgi:hypothetical protein
MDNITIAEANELWFRATINFNKKIYEVMKYLLKKKKVKMLINRNPKRLGHYIMRITLIAGISLESLNENWTISSQYH